MDILVDYEKTIYLLLFDFILNTSESFKKYHNHKEIQKKKKF